jgi:hypothetical protein
MSQTQNLKNTIPTKKQRKTKTKIKPPKKTHWAGFKKTTGFSLP